MIIACSVEGQLCNRLFHLSNFIAFALENRVKVWYPFFNDYVDYFPNLSNFSSNSKLLSLQTNKLVRFFFNRIWPFIALPISRLMGFQLIDARSNFSPDQPHFIYNASTTYTFVTGFLFRSQINLQKHGDRIRSLFKFDAATNLLAEKLINSLRNKDNSAIVGVHIRRGDYKQWQNGAYYFEDNTYASLMQKMLENLASRNLLTTFVIVSNEPEKIGEKAFDGLSYSRSSNSEIVDLCLLTKCDYIIGPPSTFSSWASFYGQVPLFHLRSREDELSLADFTING
jgi:hypothetical protein